jgi:hypothetical protein
MKGEKGPEILVTDAQDPADLMCLEQPLIDPTPDCALVDLEHLGELLQGVESQPITLTAEHG